MSKVTTQIGIWQLTPSVPTLSSFISPACSGWNLDLVNIVFMYCHYLITATSLSDAMLYDNLI